MKYPNNGKRAIVSSKQSTPQVIRQTMEDMRDFMKNYLKNRKKVCPRELNIKVRKASVTIHRIETDFQYLSSETFFDVAGNQLEVKSYYADKITEWKKFIYDKNNQLAEVLTGVPILRESSNDESDFHFSSETVVKKQEQEGIVQVNEMGQKIVSLLNSAGEVLRRKIFNVDNVCIEVCEYAGNSIVYKAMYDYTGQLMEARRFRSDGKPLGQLINTLNENSQLCRSKYISKTGFVTHDTVLKYNDLGLLTEIVEHPRDPNKAFADLKGGSCGWNHRYYYREDKLLDIDDVYHYGKHMRSHKYTYEFW